jgi:hypothetical protein
VQGGRVDAVVEEVEDGHHGEWPLRACHSRNIHATIREHPGNIQGAIRLRKSKMGAMGNDHSEPVPRPVRNIQAPVREQSGNKQGTFREQL